MIPIIYSNQDYWGSCKTDYYHLTQDKFIMEVIGMYLSQIFNLKTLKVILSFIAVWVTYLIGEGTQALWALLWLYIIDFIIWFSRACYLWEFQMYKMKRGIIKFILYGVAIIVGHMLDLLVMHQDIDYGAQNIIIIYLGVTEALSVLKHLARFGLKIPMRLIAKLEGIKNELDTPLWSQSDMTSASIQTETTISESVDPTEKKQ